MEDTDLKGMLLKLLRRWYWFAISIGIMLAFAIVYLRITEQEFRVATTIQLKDQSVSDQGGAQEQFLQGFTLTQSSAELADEIGILTSYTTIRQSIETLGFGVSYYAYPSMLGLFAKSVAKEVYPSPFHVYLDTIGGQLLYTPIHISFPDEQHWRVQLELDDEPRPMIDGGTQQTSQWMGEIDLDTTLALNEPVSLPYLSISLAINDSVEVFAGDDDYYITVKNADDLTERYRQQLQIAPISDKSNIVSLSLVSPVPKKETAFLDRLTEVYIDNNLAKKNRLGKKTIEFIDLQLASVADSLRETEGNLETFRDKNQVIDVGVTSQNLTGQLFGLEEKQAELNVQNEYYKYMARYLKSNNNVSDVVAPSSVGIQDPLLNSLLVQLSELNDEKITKDYSSNPNNPVLKVLERKIQNTKDALIDNIDNLIGSNDIALRENNRRISRIRQTMNELPENERDLTGIERRFTFNDNIYNYLLQKRAEAGIAIASNVADKTVIDAARQTGRKAEYPNSMVIYFLALMVGFAIPALVIVTNDYFDDKIQSKEQLAKLSNVPLVGAISQAPRRTKLAIVQDPYSSVTESFEYLRTNLKYVRKGGSSKVIGVTSCIAGEGKTFCASNLAITTARSQKKTLLIGGDFRQPTLNEYFKFRNVGLSDYLVKDRTIREVIQPTSEPNLHIVVPGTNVMNVTQLLEDPKLETFFEFARQEYDQIIVDTPPVSYVSDFFLMQSYFDVKVMVVRADYSTKTKFLSTQNMLEVNQVSPLCVVLNFSPDNQEYGYSYSKAPGAKRLKRRGTRNRKQKV